jgi:hypothetical protein
MEEIDPSEIIDAFAAGGLQEIDSSEIIDSAPAGFRGTGSSASWDEAPAKLTPGETFTGGMADILGKLTFGGGDEIAAGGTALTDKLFRGIPVGEAYDQRLAQVRGLQSRYGAENPISAGFNNVASFLAPGPSLLSKAKGLMAAGKTVAKGAGTGAAYGAAGGFLGGEGVDNRIEGATSGAKVGATIGGAIPLAVKGAGKVGGAMRSAGDAFERSSVGAGVKDYVRSLKKQGVLEDGTTGELKTRLGEAINEVGQTEGWGVIRSPEALSTRNKAVLAEVGSTIGDMTKAADAAGVSPKLDLFSKNSRTQKVIASATAEKKQLKNAFGELVDDLLDPKDGWDGTVDGLRQWKTGIQKRASAAATQGNVDRKALKKLQTAIGQDMNDAVQGAITKAKVASPKDVKNLFRRYSNRAEIQPILDEHIAKGEKDTMASILRGLLRTSGGTLTTPVLLGAAVGGSAAAIPGAVLGAGLGFLGSPTGAGLAGNVLRTAGSIARGSGGLMATPGLLPLSVQAAVQPGNDNASASALKEALYTENGLKDEGNNQPYNADDNGGGYTLKNEGYHPANLALVNGLSPEDLDPLAAAYMDLAGTKKKGDVMASNGVDPEKLLEAMIAQESSGNPNAIGPDTAGDSATLADNAKGLGQLMDDTGKEWHAKLGLPGEYDPMNAEQNKTISTAYLNWLLGQFDGDPELALTAYHSGIGRVKKLLDKEGGSKLSDIIGELGPVGKRYAGEVLGRLKKVEA